MASETTTTPPPRGVMTRGLGKLQRLRTRVWEWRWRLRTLLARRGFVRALPAFTDPAFREVITDFKGLRQIIPPPDHRVVEKVDDHIDELSAAFIAASPFAVIASRGGDGHLDCSPRGDPPGEFVKIIDRTTIALPDRPGNHRADTLTNLLDDPHVALVFLVPGKPETLRVVGTAKIVRDLWLREEMAHRGRVPELAVVVRVERVYFHCGKSITRSRLWQPALWPDASHLPTLAQAMVKHGKLRDSVSRMEQIIEKDEAERLY